MQLSVFFSLAIVRSVFLGGICFSGFCGSCGFCESKYHARPSVRLTHSTYLTHLTHLTHKHKRPHAQTSCEKGSNLALIKRKSGWDILTYFPFALWIEGPK